MKNLYQVSLFFSIGCIGFAGGIWANQTYSTLVYNQVQQELQQYVSKQQSFAQTETETYVENATVEVSTMEEATINADTIYVIEEYDGVTKTTHEIVEPMPAKYLGLTRSLLEEELALYTNAPALNDQKKGFVSTNLVTFSEDKIVVRKNYYLEEAIEAPSYYFLRNEEGRIIVYAHDLQTLYLTTDIMFETLPTTLQEEINQVKRLDSEEEVYKFLEAYSS